MADIVLIHPDLTATKMSIPDECLAIPLKWVSKADLQKSNKVFFGNGQVTFGTVANDIPYYVYEYIKLVGGGGRNREYHVYIRREVTNVGF